MYTNITKLILIVVFIASNYGISEELNQSTQNLNDGLTEHYFSKLKFFRSILYEDLDLYDSIQDKEKYINNPLSIQDSTIYYSDLLQAFKVIKHIMPSYNPEEFLKKYFESSFVQKTMQGETQGKESLGQGIIATYVISFSQNKKVLYSYKIKFKNFSINISEKNDKFKMDIDINFKYVGSHPLIIASILDKTIISRKLIENGASINFKNTDGMTPLLLSSKSGFTKMVILLLKNNAQINIKNNAGMTPLMFASKNGYSGIATLLLKNEADINTKNNAGMTPLLFASKYGFLDIASLLLKNDAEINIKNSDGMTPLMFALKNGYSGIVTLLLKNEAEVNVSNNEGITPLMYAAKHKDTSNLNILLKNNALIDVQDNNKKTALMYAAQSGYYYPAKELIEAGANKNLRDSNSKTAEDLAVSDARGIFRWDSSHPFLGFNLASSKFTSKGYSSDFCGGLSIGYNIRLAYKFFLQFKASYNYRSTIQENSTMFESDINPNYDLNFIELTPTIKYVFEMGLSGRGGFYVLGGAGIQYLIAAKLLDSTDEDDSSIDILKNSDKILYAINSGIGFGNNTAFVEVRYSYGLPAVINDIKTSVNTMSVNFGFGW